MPEGEQAQEGPYGPGRHHPAAEHAPGGSRAQQLHIIDAVPGHDVGSSDNEDERDFAGPWALGQAPEQCRCARLRVKAWAAACAGTKRNAKPCNRRPLHALRGAISANAQPHEPRSRRPWQHREPVGHR
jgi:hypothetical protein